ncbi:4753_t:CDS:2, partial [Funneliformis mosseae]
EITKFNSLRMDGCSRKLSKSFMYEEIDCILHVIWQLQIFSSLASNYRAFDFKARSR